MRKCLIGLVAGMIVWAVAASSAAAAPLPVIYNGAYGFAHASPTANPPGANNWACNGAAQVHTLIGLAPSNHGTTLDGMFTLASYFPGANAALVACPACAEQEAGSPFMTTEPVLA